MHTTTRNKKPNSVLRPLFSPIAQPTPKPLVADPASEPELSEGTPEKEGGDPASGPESEPEPEPETEPETPAAPAGPVKDCTKELCDNELTDDLLLASSGIRSKPGFDRFFPAKYKVVSKFMEGILLIL